jgi:hypothetical protein
MRQRDRELKTKSGGGDQENLTYLDLVSDLKRLQGGKAVLTIR